MRRVGAFTVAPSEPDLRALYEEQQDAQPTFAPLGAVLRDERPTGYRRDRYGDTIGLGDVAWERAVEGLREWSAHRNAGLRVYPPDVPVRAGETVIVMIGRAIAALATCRITATFDEPARFGFVYATLPVHPERGEEAFVVTRDDGNVRFTIDVLSTYADPIARVGGPLTRRVQRVVSKRYVRGLEAFVASEAR